MIHSRNIPHFEDLVWSLPSSKIFEIMNAMIFAIGGYNTGAFHLKLDGTFFVVGSDEEGYFVSNKSYLNKTPIKYRTLEQIESAQMHYTKKSKLDQLWKIFHPHSHNLKNKAWTGEFLMMRHSQPLELDLRHAFQPNIIEYSFKHIPERIHNEYFIYAWHDPNTPAFHSDDAGLKIRTWIAPRFEDHSDLFLYVHDLNETEPVGDESVIKEIKKAYNKEIRKEVDFWSWPSNIPFRPHNIFNFHNLIFFKNEILRYLNSLDHELECKINGMPSNHEGFIFTYGDIQVKLVDRYEFSRANFDPNTSRGWDLNK